MRSPRNRTIALPGYWDGGRRMVIRFAPTEGGEWAFRLTSNVAALNGPDGHIHGRRFGCAGFRQSGERASLALHRAAEAAPVDGRHRAAVRIPGRRRVPRHGRCARGAEVQPSARMGDRRWRRCGLLRARFAQARTVPQARRPRALSEPERHHRRSGLGRRRRNAHQAFPQGRISAGASCATWWRAMRP